MSEPVVHEEVPNESPLVTMGARELLQVVLRGALVGAVAATVYLLLNKFVFTAVLCRPQSTGDCNQASNYAAIAALVLSIFGGVIVLAQARVYRPLLVVLAALISLWGIQDQAGGAEWYVVIVAAAMLLGLSYGLYAWLARIRNFILAIVVTVVAVVLIHWILVA